MALPGMIPGNNTDEFTTGIQFTVPSNKTLTGIRAYWIAGNTSPITLKFRLWNLATSASLLSEDVSHTTGMVQTTGSFGTQALSTGTTYAVSVWNHTWWLNYVANSISMPAAYADYTVTGSYAYYFRGDAAPSTNLATYCAYIEPLF